MPAFAIVLVAAGASTRMGFDKVWADLDGRSVLAHAIAAATQAAPAELVLVVAAGREADAQRLAPDARVVTGGARRRDSVQAGVAACVSDWIAVHDAARALVPSDTFARGLRAAQAFGAAVPGLPVKDTLKRVANSLVTETVPREEIVSVQTPQIFRRDLLLAALASTDDDVTDESALVERLGNLVVTFPGHDDAFKITTPFDFDLAALVLSRRAAAR